ncbi:FadR/GntR family transcriptional regulator [Agromyces soli]|uniref:FadR family transcriptional regulator n=1 Tax=Agromyces soli TaxID=659012 RepID=A0ABY4APX8_9MICO|nr:FadR/GntR family transcriptional regulator [Agromyces soli]UOE25168.1 FadR family transcriptional regulator [Agromyces soli]
MEPIQRRSLVDTVVDRLHTEITSGSWPVGSRIPTEAELTEQLGVSRPSVREAVRSIVQLGLLETRQGDGTYVVADDPTEVALRRTIDVADAREVLTVRRALDVLAAREAATNHDAVDLAVLRDALAGRRAAIRAQDAEAFADHDVAFHLGVAAASHNRLLVGLYTSFDASLRHSVASNSCLSNNSDPNTADLHEALFRAIERADVDAASAAAVGVLDQSEQSLDG